ncbi:hypothetical protein APTSU1_000967800 [Apodemus speciosus]|uniref:Glucocorticoid receptor n=1 Tax=Apodemus speciosus TaxID=105296 RepID=A0ABQ0F598_APOSI
MLAFKPQSSSIGTTDGAIESGDLYNVLRADRRPGEKAQK